MAVSVTSDRDHVIVDLHGRRRDVLLSCDAASIMADALEQHATDAEVIERTNPSVFKGEPWGVRCQSFDGAVALRFDPPGPGNPSRVPMPPRVARQLAAKLRFERSFAEHRARLIVQTGQHN